MSGFMGRLSSVLGKFSEARTRQDIIKDGYNIVSATGNDVDRVLHLMRRSFFKDEPSIVGCGVKKLSNSMQHYLVGDLTDGKSLMAVGRDGRVLGVCLATELVPGACRDLQKVADDCGDRRAATLLRFWAHLVQISRLPEALGVPSVWEVEILATDPAARGLGIAKELTVQSRELACRSGFPAMCIFCTSEYSNRMCRSLRMRHHLHLPYAEYRDARGRQLVSPPPPHWRASVYVDDLRGDRTSTAEKSDALVSAGNR